jgi:vacuolar protein sorting-associated protein 18
MSNLFEEWEQQNTSSRSSSRPAVAAVPQRRLSGIVPAVPAQSLNPFAVAAAAAPVPPPPPPVSRNPFAQQPVQPAVAAPTAAIARPSTRQTQLPVADKDAVFSLRKPDDTQLLALLQRPATRTVVAAAAAGGTVILGTNDCRVVRWQHAAPTVCDEIEISRRHQDVIHKVFVDPTGTHVLVALQGGETHYIHKSSTKARKLAKWSGAAVECVAFDRRRGSDSTTRSILVGTQSGDIYEALLDSSGKDKPFTLLYSLGAHLPVASLLFETPAFAVHAESKLLVLAAVASPTRLYTFVGGPTFEALFKQYREAGAAAFQELPGSMPTTELHGCYTAAATAGAGGSSTAGSSSALSAAAKSLRLKASNTAAATPATAVLHSFAMLTSAGIYHGRLAPSSELTYDDPSTTAAATVAAGAVAAVSSAVSTAGSDVGDSYNNSSSSSSTSSSSDYLTVVDAQLQAYPGAGDAPPRSLAVTHHHFLLLYSDRLVAVSRLTGEVAQDVPVDLHWGRPLQLIGTAVAASPTAVSGVWVCTDKLPRALGIQREGRNVWRMHLERALNGDESEFDTALRHCPSRVEEVQVQRARADRAFAAQQYAAAAALYAQTAAPFEEVALNFAEAGQDSALRLYITEKLGTLSPTVHKAQRTMLCTWLAELYLRALNAHSSSSSSTTSSNSNDGSSTQQQQLRQQFRAFLERHHDALNPASTSALLSSHGCSDELLFFAELTGDYERVLAHHTAHRAGSSGPDYPAALAVLRRAPLEKVESLVYRYSAVLMDADPGGTIAVWIGKPQLKPTKLIPALVRYSKHRGLATGATAATAGSSINGSSSGSGGQDWAIVYLEHCVNRLQLQDPAIHNHLLTLYAQAEANAEEQPQQQQQQQQRNDSASSATTGDAPTVTTSAVTSSPLMDLLSRPPERRYFNLKYALRVCTQLGRRRACVQIYSAMGLFEEAVDLALAVDLQMAKANADKPADADLRKRLWLKIAKHTVLQRGTEGAAAATAILGECGDLLKIEDILPFFPDFAVIDSFKADICSTLEAYNARIEQLRAEMQEYTESAEATQAEIIALKNRSLYVSSSQLCELCDAPALTQEFYLFPCGHAFHSQCLSAHMQQHLNSGQRSEVTRLREQIAAAESSAVMTKRAALQLKAMRSELDGFVAAECVLCGELMVQSIDKPLVHSDDAEEAKQWDLLI